MVSLEELGKKSYESLRWPSLLKEKFFNACKLIGGEMGVDESGMDVCRTKNYDISKSIR